MFMVTKSMAIKKAIKKRRKGLIWRIRLLSAVLCFLLFSMPVLAYDNTLCAPRDVEIIIDNQVTPEHLHYNYAKSARDISWLAEGKDVDSLFYFLIWYKDLTVDFFPSFSSSQMLNNGCPKRINVAFTVYFPKSMIYVANKYLEGTDAYNRAQRDANEHARLVIDNTADYLNDLKYELRRFVSGMQIHSPENKDEFTDSKNYIRKRLADIIYDHIWHLSGSLNEILDRFDAEKPPISQQDDDKKDNSWGSRFRGMVDVKRTK